MNKIISYIHLIGCVGFTLLLVSLLIKEGIDAETIVGKALVLTTTISGIYLFIIGRNRSYTKLEKLQVENSILETRIKQKELKQKLDND